MNSRWMSEDCARARHNLEAWLLGALSSADSASLALHTSICDACSAEAREAGRVIARLRALGVESHTARRRAAPRRVAVMATACAGVLVAAVFFGGAMSAGKTPAGESTRAPAGNGADVEAVRWLVAAQRIDGSWSDGDGDGARAPSTFSVGITALATLALLRTETPSGDVAQAAERGSEYLARSLDESAAPESFRVHIQAASARALTAAAKRWPARFTRPAEAALRALKSWQQQDGAFDDASASATSTLATLLALGAFQDALDAELHVGGLRRATTLATTRVRGAEAVKGADAEARLLELLLREGAGARTEQRTGQNAAPNAVRMASLTLARAPRTPRI